MIANVVCFDIGGVLVRIRHTWRDVLAAVDLVPTWSEPRPHASDPVLCAYQDGTLQEAEYLDALSAHLGIERPQARRAHDAILDADYPGAFDLVRRLRREGVGTACLSNTNALHWERLLSPDHYPAVASLDRHFSSFEIGANKPDEAAFRTVAEAYPEARVVFFDDALANVEAARRFGWDAYRVDPEGDPAEFMAGVLGSHGLLRAHLVAA